MLPKIEVLAKRLIERFANALDLEQFFQGGQRAVLIPVFDDPAGQHRPDLGDNAQILSLWPC